MADEIRNQNVVTITNLGHHWRAQIGPDGLGISILANTPGTALLLLASAVIARGWQFDPSYTPKPDASLHDA